MVGIAALRRQQSLQIRKFAEDCRNLLGRCLFACSTRLLFPAEVDTVGVSLGDQLIQLKVGVCKVQILVTD